METIYINLDARQITARRAQADRKACVGQEEPVCYTVLPRQKTPPQGGKVLDFEACRRALEDAGPAPAAPSAGEEEAPAPRRRWDLTLAADLVASAGVLGAALAVAARFFLG